MPTSMLATFFGCMGVSRAFLTSMTVLAGAPEIEVAYIARGLAFEEEVLNFAALTDIWRRFSSFFSDDPELFVAMIAYAVATCALALNYASRRRGISAPEKWFETDLGRLAYLSINSDKICATLMSRPKGARSPFPR